MVIGHVDDQLRALVVASDGAYPLLGTQLLSGRRLTIDYAARTVELA